MVLYHAGGRSIYLPGSSLKGAIRAHAERIVRTVGDDKPNSKKLPWANDPLNDKYDYLKTRDGKDPGWGNADLDGKRENAKLRLDKAFTLS
jgi:CRISPR/Cas system CSM-associated protein Csm3 (group 7 of RAMP superfamily)